MKVRIVADSVGPAGIRLTTIEATYHRYIHSEVMTYGSFTRNAASSRAIPIAKMRKAIWSNPAMPVHWGANQAGMQAHAELTGWRRWAAIKAWMLGCYLALFVSWLLMKLGVHKQITNRVTEPWMFITTIITADEYAWANMFHQRNHPDAQPEFQKLARMIWVEYNTHKPTILKAGEWHLPFIYTLDINEAIKLVAAQSPDPLAFLDIKADDPRVVKILKEVSTGRCARVSYLNHNGQRSMTDDMELHDKLKNAVPGHWSPFGHPAQALTLPATRANFHGWLPYRKEFANEFMSKMPEWKPEEYGLKLMPDHLYWQKLPHSCAGCEVCHCGAPMKGHAIWDNHTATPMCS